MLVAGLITLKDAAASIDYETIALLFGMMVLVGYLRIAGFFQLAADSILHCQPGPFTMLAMTMGLSGVLSAFLVNDVVCVSLTPLILNLCQRSRRKPLPHLIGLAVASNVGSAATITGNPQNIIIGSLSGISYLLSRRHRRTICQLHCRGLGLPKNTLCPGRKWSGSRREIFRGNRPMPVVEGNCRHCLGAGLVPCGATHRHCGHWCCRCDADQQSSTDMERICTRSHVRRTVRLSMYLTSMS